MNCMEFKEWLINSDAFERGASGKAMKHIQACPDCKQLYSTDHQIENQLRAYLTKVEPPERLIKRIDNDVRSFKKKSRHRQLWKKVIIPFSVAALLILFLFPPREKFVSADQIAELAMNDHINHQALAFRADEVKSIPEWFNNNSVPDIVLPEKTMADLKLIGGSKCILGKAKTALLCYKKNGKRVSLFVIKVKDLGFSIESNDTFTIKKDENTINIWKDAGLLYAMVE